MREVAYEYYQGGIEAVLQPSSEGINLFNTAKLSQVDALAFNQKKDNL